MASNRFLVRLSNLSALFLRFRPSFFHKHRVHFVWSCATILTILALLMLWSLFPAPPSAPPPPPSSSSALISGTSSPLDARAVITVNTGKALDDKDLLLQWPYFVDEWQSKSGLWSLHLLYNVTRCMDGSAGGIWVRTPVISTNPWILAFVDGVAWCHHYSSCRARGFGAPFYRSASSSSWKKTPPFASFHGLFGSPHFPLTDWNIAVFGYCDASAFTGQRQRTTLVGGKPYLFHGRHNLEMYLKYLKVKWQVGTSSNGKVLIYGREVGSISALLALPLLLDHFSTPNRDLYLVIEDSYFMHLPHNGEDARRMRMAFTSWNASGSVSSACLHTLAISSDTSEDQSWTCLMPNWTFQHFPQRVRAKLFSTNKDIMKAFLFDGSSAITPLMASAEETSLLDEHCDQSCASLRDWLGQ